MTAQLLVLDPLKQWTTEVLRLGREQGHSDREIAAWIRAYSRKSGWKDDKIRTVLKSQGIGAKYKPLRIICPKCDDVGRINAFTHPYDKGNHYVIVHHPIKGKWGETKPGKRRNTWGKNRVRKRNRCYFYNLFEQREHLKSICNQLFPIRDD